MSNAPQIMQMSLDDIRPYDNNPRDNSTAVDAVAESIKSYGFLVPIIVDADGIIVAGHTRYQASLNLELDEVPVIRAEHLTEEQAQAFRLIDNKTAELATWDFDLLSNEIATLAESGLDLTPFGWTQEEVDCLSHMVTEDCMSEVPEDDSLAQREDGDGVTGAAQANRGSSAISRDPKSVRVAIGEINFFVDIEEYREWAHEIRKANGHDMQRIVDDLAGKLGLAARPMRRTAAQTKQEEPVEEEKAPARKRPAKAKPVGKAKKEKVTRPARKRSRPKTDEQKLRDAVDEAEQ